MYRRRGRTAPVSILAALLLMVSACSGPAPSSVTRANYDKLSLGMTFEAVTEIMGTPPYHSKRFGLDEYTWVNGDRHIHAKFLANRAIYYSSKGLDDAVPRVAEGHSDH